MILNANNKKNSSNKKYVKQEGNLIYNARNYN